MTPRRARDERTAGRDASRAPRRSSRHRRGVIAAGEDLAADARRPGCTYESHRPDLSSGHAHRHAISRRRFLRVRRIGRIRRPSPEHQSSLSNVLVQLHAHHGERQRGPATDASAGTGPLPCRAREGAVAARSKIVRTGPSSPVGTPLVIEPGRGRRPRAGRPPYVIDFTYAVTRGPPPRAAPPAAPQDVPRSELQEMSRTSRTSASVAVGGWPPVGGVLVAGHL